MTSLDVEEATERKDGKGNVEEVLVLDEERKGLQKMLSEMPILRDVQM